MGPLVPTVEWAQRKDVVYLTIDLQDCKNPTIKITDHNLSFQGVGKSHATGNEPHEYKLDLELFAEVDDKESKVHLGDRSIVLVLDKKDKEQEYWPRLLKATGKAPAWLKVDWNKWVDEDEEDDAPDPMSNLDLASMMGGMGGMGGMMGGMGGMMGGMGGMGGMDMSALAGMQGMQDAGEEELDSDDDEIPNLE